MSEQDNLKIVGEFFAAWEGGTYAQLRRAYEDFLTDDCVYENSGLPACEGKAAALALIDGIQAMTGIESITAEIRRMAGAGDVVFSERIDHHYDAGGVENLSPRICGVMELRDGRIAAWRDYFDAAALQAALGGHSA